MRPEKMRVWQAAEELLAEIDRLAVKYRAAAPNAIDHLERSGESVMFNIGEGTGAYKPKQKMNAYEIAKKEASEIKAVLRRLVIRKVAPDAEIKRAHDLAGGIMAMLTTMILTQENRIKG